MVSGVRLFVDWWDNRRIFIWIKSGFGCDILMFYQSMDSISCGPVLCGFNSRVSHLCYEIYIGHLE